MNNLLKIQAELKAPKNQYNKFGNYKYRSAEDILEAVKPLLEKAGATLTLSDEIVAVGSRVYVKATATFVKDEEAITTTAFAREEETKKGMDASQITGTASSYARKYALNGLFLIDDTKDADTNEHASYTVNNPTAKDIEKIAKDIAETDREKVIRIFHSSLDEATQNNVLKGLNLKKIEDIKEQADIDKLFNNYIKWEKV